MADCEDTVCELSTPVCVLQNYRRVTVWGKMAPSPVIQLPFLLSFIVFIVWFLSQKEQRTSFIFLLSSVLWTECYSPHIRSYGFGLNQVSPRQVVKNTWWMDMKNSEEVWAHFLGWADEKRQCDAPWSYGMPMDIILTMDQAVGPSLPFPHH